jgi:hypothetical protein
MGSMSRRSVTHHFVHGDSVAEKVRPVFKADSTGTEVHKSGADAEQEAKKAVEHNPKRRPFGGRLS